MPTRRPDGSAASRRSRSLRADGSLIDAALPGRLQHPTPAARRHRRRRGRRPLRAGSRRTSSASTSTSPVRRRRSSGAPSGTRISRSESGTASSTSTATETTTCSPSRRSATSGTTATSARRRMPASSPRPTAFATRTASRSSPTARTSRTRPTSTATGRWTFSSDDWSALSPDTKRPEPAPRGYRSSGIVTDRFEEIEIVAQIGSLHGANTMALGDVDGDGDEDLFWGDYFEPGILFIENTGTCQSPNLTRRAAPLPDTTSRCGRAATTRPPSVTWTATVTRTSWSVRWAERTTRTRRRSTTSTSSSRPRRAASSIERPRFLSTLDYGAESVPVAVDLDGDGDRDLLVGNKIEQNDTQNGKLFRLLNVGTDAAPRFREDGDMDVGGGYHLVPAFGDLDGDGDLDAIVGTWSARSCARTATTPRTAASPSRCSTRHPVVLSRGRNATPALGDLDGDGDLDLIARRGVRAPSTTGRTRAPRRTHVFTLVSDEYADIDVGRRQPARPPRPRRRRRPGPARRLGE